MGHNLVTRAYMVILMDRLTCQEALCSGGEGLPFLTSKECLTHMYAIWGCLIRIMGCEGPLVGNAGATCSNAEQLI